MIQVNKDHHRKFNKNREKVERKQYQCESQSQFQVQSERMLKNHTFREKKNKGKKNNQGIWTNQENIKYERFLSKHLNIFSENILIRRKKKIHVLMSKSIKTRTPQQCRSHHQKMLQSHQNIIGIIEFLKKEYKILDKHHNIIINTEEVIKMTQLLQQQNQDILNDFQMKNSPLFQYYSPDSPRLEEIKTILWWDGQFI